MKTKFAVNYSLPLADLITKEQVSIDLFKLPAWPAEIEDALQLCPIYIHFPLTTGRDIFQSIEFEAQKINQEIDLLKLIEGFQIEKVNLHIGAISTDLPQIPQNAVDAQSKLEITKFLIQGCSQAIEIFGSEKIILENNIQGLGYTQAASCLPDVIAEVVRETGAGFLFDLSHARLSAEEFHMDEKDYINQLPLDKLDEMHITGIQLLDEKWVQFLRKRGGNIPLVEKFAGHKLDHLPLTETDWLITQWSIDRIKSGDWRKPRVAAFEYGGVGEGFFSASVQEHILFEQIPQLNKLIMELNHD